MRTLGLLLGGTNGKKSSSVPAASTLFNPTTWTGTGAALEINNNIDLTGGGFVWIKSRAAQSAFWFDTVRGPNLQFTPTSTAGSASTTDALNSFDSDGYHLGVQANVNTLSNGYVGWTWKKAPRFFDVLQYTGTGAQQTIAHSLGVAPGMIILKRRDNIGSACVYHRLSGANAGSQYWLINDINAPTVNDITFGGVPADSSVFSVGSSSTVNALGGTYLAYIFAHDPTGNIACGSYTGTGVSGTPTIDLGWQPQFIMILRATGGTASKVMLDKGRGINVGADAILLAESTGAETSSDVVELTATGFKIIATTASYNISGSTYCYMAIKT